MSFISNAQVTVHFTLNITDTYTCSQSWNGDYCAQIYVMEGSNQHCVTTICDMDTGDNDIRYDCNLPYSEGNRNYQIVVRVCRNESPLTCCGSLVYSQLLYFYQVTNNSVTIYSSL